MDKLCDICRKEYALFVKFMATGKDICGGCRRKELKKNAR